jgi:ChpA-C
MRTWVKGTAPAALLALGVMAMGSGTAFADTIGDHSIGGGNQVKAPIKLPIDISGNAVGVLGGAKTSSEGGASVDNGGGGGGGAGGNRTSGDHSILGGNQIVAPITAPINACGNAVAVLGKAKAGCEGGASVENGGGGGGAGGNVTSGRGSILGGNQIVAPITAPINVCGNSVAVLGDAFAGCEGGAKVTGRDRPGWPDGPGKPGWPGKPGKPKGPGKSGYSERGSRPGGHGAGSGWQGPRSGGNGSGPGWDVPRSGGHGSGPGWQGPRSGGNGSGSGWQGSGPGWQGSGPGWDVPGSGAGGNRTSGQGSILGGNQIVAPITAPINVCGNAVAVLGDAAAGCLGGAHVGGPSGHPGGNGGGQGGWNGGWNGGGQGGNGGDYGHRVGKQRTSGLMSASPLTPASEAKDASGVARKSGSALSSLPVVGGVQDAAKLPELPIMGAAQDVAGLPATSGNAQAPESQGSSAVDSVTKLAPSTPLDGVVPLGDVGLMSAAQPVGMTGMNSGSLLALVLGAMAAASATLFATTRRLRLGRK